MSGTAGDTPSGGGGTDTQQGASFALTVPGPGTPALPTFADLARFGAVDETDETQLPVDPASPTGPTFASDSVPSPFADGGLSYTTNSLQMVGPNGYVRLGAPSQYERWLTTDVTATTNNGPTQPTVPQKLDKQGNPEWPLGGQGILLHSNQKISLFAPSINQTTNTRLNVTWAEKDRIGILSGQTQEAGSMTNATYQVVDDLTTSVGNLLSTVTGSSATVWTGADASTGLGSLLWSNFGATQNVFGGMVVNLTHGDVEVQGAWPVKYQDTSIFSPNEIFLGVAGTAAPTVLAVSYTNMTKAVNYLSGVLINVMSVLLTTQTGTMADLAAEDDDKLTSALADFKDEMWVLTGLVAALQIAGTALGIALVNASIPAPATASSKIQMTNGSIVLTAGGTRVSIDGTGFKVFAGNPEDVLIDTVNMAAVSIQAPLGAAAQATLTNPVVVGTGFVPANAPPPIPVQSINFSCAGVFNAAATQFTFTLPI